MHYSKIKSIKKIGLKRTFDLHTPKYENFILDNGILSHNSGKSTLLYLFFKNFKDFKIKDKLTYNRNEMIKLIKNYKFSYCWNDELISSANKRKFYDIEQIELLEVLTKYRLNFNITAGAVPIFFTLDKELLKLFGMHINIIRRGIGVVHLPREGRLYTDDIWDVKTNAKLEEKWSQKKQKNPNFKIPYNKYSTFAGYVYFRALTKHEEEVYDKWRAIKKEGAEQDKEENGKKDNFFEKILRIAKEGKLNEQGLLQLCQFENKKMSSVKTRLNQMLKDEGNGKTLKDFLSDGEKKNKSNSLNNNLDPTMITLSNDDL